MYLRFAALGDSTTYGIGDPGGAGATTRHHLWRGWARLLAAGLADHHDVSLCNLAAPGATAACVRSGQVGEAVAHRPQLASLIVGVNDTLRSTWRPAEVRADLLHTAAMLDDAGATLLTVRFHDHGAVVGLPGPLRRALRARIEALNAVYDEIHARYEGLRVDLGALPEVTARECWHVDRLHPSERGHRLLAAAFAEALALRGVAVTVPATEPDGLWTPTWRSDLRWLVGEGAPWVGRRARDLGPWAARAVVAPVRPGVGHRTAAGSASVPTLVDHDPS